MSDCVGIPAQAHNFDDEVVTLIQVENVTKIYPVYQKGKGGWLKKFFSNATGKKVALDDVSMSIDEGEFVALLGPNGAGKSTMVKILSGILTPTSGSTRVMGLDPVKDRKKHAYHIGVMFGQKTQLWWDLPLIDSFHILGHIYNVPKRVLRQRMKDLTDLTDMSRFLHTSVRQLSLGERMRGELAASLLHDPPILFLDEPTIGLDVVSKHNIQSFLKKINKEMKKTIILTTHNMDDIEKLCKRVVFLNLGQKLLDDSIDKLLDFQGHKKYIVVELEDVHADLAVTYEKKEANEYWVPYTVESEVLSIVERIREGHYSVKSIRFVQPQLEDVIKRMYEQTSSEEEEVATPVQTGTGLNM